MDAIVGVEGGLLFQNLDEVIQHVSLRAHGDDLVGGGINNRKATNTADRHEFDYIFHGRSRGDAHGVAAHHLVRGDALQAGDGICIKMGGMQIRNGASDTNVSLRQETNQLAVVVDDGHARDVVRREDSSTHFQTLFGVHCSHSLAFQQFPH